MYPTLTKKSHTSKWKRHVYGNDYSERYKWAGISQRACFVVSLNSLLLNFFASQNKKYTKMNNLIENSTPASAGGWSNKCKFDVLSFLTPLLLVLLIKEVLWCRSIPQETIKYSESVLNRLIFFSVHQKDLDIFLIYSCKDEQSCRL